MEVALLKYTPNGERLVAAAAKNCKSSKSIAEIYGELSDNDIERLINMTIKMGHMSVFEHVSFTFAIEGISRACSHQLVRHRLASYTQRSQRYVKQENNQVVPQSIIEDEERLKTYINLVQQIEETYDKLVELGTPVEDARYIQPNAASTHIVMTINARSLMNFFSLRTCKQAQWEIRELANKMLDLVKPIYPIIFQKAGPMCQVEGKCLEGRTKFCKW